MKLKYVFSDMPLSSVYKQFSWHSTNLPVQAILRKTTLFPRGSDGYLWLEWIESAL